MSVDELRDRVEWDDPELADLLGEWTVEDALWFLQNGWVLGVDRFEDEDEEEFYALVERGYHWDPTVGEMKNIELGEPHNRDAWVLAMDYSSVTLEGMR